MDQGRKRDRDAERHNADAATLIEEVFARRFPDGLICGEDFKPTEAHSHLLGTRVKIGVEVLRDAPGTLDELIACVDAPGDARRNGIVLYPIPLEDHDVQI